MNGMSVVESIIEFCDYFRNNSNSKFKELWDDITSPIEYQIYDKISKKYNKNRSLASLLSVLDQDNLNRMIEYYIIKTGKNNNASDIIEEGIKLLLWLYRQKVVNEKHIELEEDEYKYFDFCTKTPYIYEKELEKLNSSYLKEKIYHDYKYGKPNKIKG